MSKDLKNANMKRSQQRNLRSRNKVVKEETVRFQRLRKKKVPGKIRCWLETVHWICTKVVIDHLINGNSKGASWIKWVEEWMGNENF